MNKWKKLTAMSLAAAALAVPAVGHAADDLNVYSQNPGQALHIEQIGRYTSGAAVGEGGTEIVAYDANTQHAFSVNGAAKSLDILDLAALKDGKEIPLVKRVALESFGVSASDVTSVAIHPDGSYIAVAVPSEVKTDPGHVVLLDTDGNTLASVEVGALPDMVTFTPDGTKVLVANEGEPSEDYTVNPEGSVSIINIANGTDNLTAETAAFTDDIVEDDVRKVNPDPENSSYAENLEPEYITVDKDSRFAYVAIQESNAIAKLDLQTNSFTTVKSLGYKDFSKAGVELDPSNKDGGIEIGNWPVLGMYMPDGMTSFQSGGNTYILTANEGDAQEWDGFSEEERVADLAEEDMYALNADLYEGYNQEQLDQLIENRLFEKESLGRLKTSTVAPKNEDGKYEAVYAYGTRSFSVWDANSLQQVYDSGADFEKITAAAIPEYFNATNDEDKFDNRSDDKGPEPESVITGDVDGTTYAFIGLERTGGIMAYDMSNPASPSFSTYFTSRNFQGDEAAVDSNSGDVAPEGLTYIAADESPTNQPILLAAHEVSGTIAAYALGEEPAVKPAPEEEAEQPENETKNPAEEEPKPEDTKEEETAETPEQAGEEEIAENEKPADETEQKPEQTEEVKTEINTEKTDGTDAAEQQTVPTAAAALDAGEDPKGQHLPNTSTNVFNWMLAGAGAIAAGVIFFVINKLRKRA
ncbi:choice-of-anchor I family protein [Terribacillus sp. DMT04]|uniref:choice-of-anchor I family protein n=1 Tax=Terribacillus sp. DMT04 TaxID=2850441 RepID=UPI001C2B93E2|nr:choice-of-anchor I family protein [Terribacillus sp. DMT04]QXE01093.1 choice-of-anchor I family protein [Terribacillus sp. DMT04]